MNIYLDEVLNGFQEAIDLLKQGQNVFEMGNEPLFPNISSQAKWKYAKGHNFIRLSDGQHVYAFNMPEGESPDNEFNINRKNNISLDKFEEGATSKGLAQIHRADPGSIYFTIQEGYRNPTYTFRHVGESKWRAIPKKKKIGKPLPVQTTQSMTGMLPGEGIVVGGVPEAVKQGMEEEMSKHAGEWDLFFGDRLARAGNQLVHGLMMPGRDWAQNSGLGAAAAGAGAGTLYHMGKKYLYNTPEENEEEARHGGRNFLKRIVAPAGLAWLASAIQGPTFSEYYKDVATGNKQVHDLFPTARE